MLVDNDVVVISVADFSATEVAGLVVRSVTVDDSAAVCSTAALVGESVVDGAESTTVACHSFISYVQFRLAMLYWFPMYGKRGVVNAHVDVNTT